MLTLALCWFFKGLEEFNGVLAHLICMAMLFDVVICVAFSSIFWAKHIK